MSCRLSLCLLFTRMDMAPTMIPILILDGVTGAGTSQTLRALKAHPAWPTLRQEGRVIHVIPEVETLGEFVAELSQHNLSTNERRARLYEALDKLEHAASVADWPLDNVLERFHLSDHAFVSGVTV